jgi:DNA-binding NarL/FixJ family response regulator
MPIRVLLVDDNALFREGIAEILRRDGRFDVVGHAARGDEVVAAATGLQPDLILIDLQMPGMTGLEAIERVRQRDREIPIGVLTMFETQDDVERSLQAGASGYLVKDATPSELCDGAAAMAQGQRNLVIGSSPTPTATPTLPRKLGSETKPRRARESRLDGLTSREREVLRALATDAGNAAIARRLGISGTTLRNHIRSTYRKLGVQDRAQAVLAAVRAGLVDASSHSAPRPPVTRRDRP